MVELRSGRRAGRLDAAAAQRELEDADRLPVVIFARINRARKRGQFVCPGPSLGLNSVRS